MSADNTEALPPPANERERIFQAAALALPWGSPLVWEDWRDGHNVHLEPDDIIAIWRAALAQAEPQEPLPEFECAHQYATKRRLAVTREWIRGWDDCTDYIEGLLKARGIGKQEGT